MMNTSSLKRRLDRLERAVREHEAKKRLFDFTVKDLSEKPLWQAVDSILELERFGRFDKLNKLHSELQAINEKSTYKEYFTALALEGLVRSIIENDQSGE